MPSPPRPRTLLPKPGRRFFLLSLTSLGAGAVLLGHGLKAENRTESSYRFRTPEWEVRMSVQFLANSSTEGFHFRDRLANRAFCLSANGEEGPGCLERFVGAMAIARYAFRSRRQSATPLNLRERVLTIDNDSRMSPPPPFERALAVEREMVSDIQAFGYNPDDPVQAAFHIKPLAAWRLLRQDLYLNGQTTAFLIVHWKHTLDVISLVDVIPGDETEWIR
jgi:hypothetical protein